jgi:hypothetical protein
MSRESGIIGGVMGMGCLFQAIVFGIYGWLAYISVDYITNYFGTDLPWIADLLIGIVSVSASIWIALILWLVG